LEGITMTTEARTTPEWIKGVPALRIDATLANFRSASPLSPEQARDRLTLRQRNEREIAVNLIDHLKRARFTLVEIDTGDSVEKVRTTDAALELLFNLDEARLVFRFDGGPFEHNGKARRGEHVVLLIWDNGNDGWDAVTDWNFYEGDPDGFDAALDAFLTRLAAQEITGH
jgi:hypothetical protein